MKRGPKPQTPEQQKARGETRPSRAKLASVVEFPKVSAAPKPPDWLTNADALKMWNDLAERLVTAGVLTECDVDHLAHMCQLHGTIVTGYRCGTAPNAAMLARLQAMMADFGLSPGSRSRVGNPDGGETGNKFNRNRKKKT